MYGPRRGRFIDGGTGDDFLNGIALAAMPRRVSPRHRG
jgi:hypothetical protein